MQVELPVAFQALFQPSRYKVYYGGRGGAKTVGFAKALIAMALQRRIRVLCAREFQKSISESVHKVLKDQIEEMGVNDKFRVIKTSILCLTTGSEFGFEGIKQNVNKIRSWEGADICWVEEAAAVTKESWKVLIPTIRKPNSEIWISFNPELEEDYTYNSFVINPRRHSIVQKVNWRDNPWFPAVLREEMEEMREADHNEYLHVWEGHCRRVLDGAVYGTEYDTAVDEKRICDVPYYRETPVDTYWDLGRSDKTAIWFKQNVGFERRILRYYENSGKHLDHYLQFMQGLGYTYGKIYLPHDAKAETLGSHKSIQEQIKAKGYKVVIVPKLSVADGIDSARRMFANCWFDKTLTKSGLYCLKRYRYEVKKVDPSDRNIKLYSSEPVHDQFSHGADAWRYMGVADSGPPADDKSYVKKFLDMFEPSGEAYGAQGWMG